MKLDIDLEWTLRSACQNVDPETFFPKRQASDDPSVRAAIEICLSCPVRQTCLDYALHFEGTELVFRDGIYGGLTPRQRNAIGKKTRKDLPPEVRQLAHTAPSADVRAWAAANGHPVTNAGMIRQSLRLAYAVAMHNQQAGGEVA